MTVCFLPRTVFSYNCRRSIVKDFAKVTLLIQPVVSVQITFCSRIDPIPQSGRWNSPEVDPFHVWLDGVRYCVQVSEGAVHFSRNVADACFGTVSPHWFRSGQEKQKPEQPSLQVRGVVGAHAHCAQGRSFHTLSRTMKPPGDADTSLSHMETNIFLSCAFTVNEYLRKFGTASRSRAHVSVA